MPVWCKTVGEPQRLKFGAISKIWRYYINCHIRAWNLKKNSRHCIWTLFLSLAVEGVGLDIIFALRAAVSKIRADFLICHIWAWNLEFKKVPTVAYGPSFCPSGSKLSSFSWHGQRFSRYGPIFKIAIFRHENCQELHMDPISTPEGLKLSSFSLYEQRFPI